MKKLFLTTTLLFLTLICFSQLDLELDYLKEADTTLINHNHAQINKKGENNKALICFDCLNACSACGFTTPPNIPQVTGGCPNYPFVPPLTTGQSATRCATFIANNTTVSFGVIVSSDCGYGNVSNFTWTLQSSVCGSVLQSGNLSSLTFNGLIIGQSYTFCYTFTVPTATCYHWLWGYYSCGSCEHTTHYPYFVGATVLPIILLEFKGYNVDEHNNYLYWTTTSEINNDYFTIERSIDAINFEPIETIGGAGNSNIETNYYFVDDSYWSNINYYRLKQTDYNGEFTYSKNIVVIKDNSGPNYLLKIDSKYIHITGVYNYKLYDMVGNLVKYGKSNVINIDGIAGGLYILKIEDFIQKIILR